MEQMFKKVNSKEKVVGWYSTGPKIKTSDIDIHEIFKKYLQVFIFTHF
jgi:26S proteasome regulatory subunit N8